MKEMSNTLKSALDKALADTGEFTMEQAPCILKEFYAWQLFNNIVWIEITAIIMISVLIMLNNVIMSGSKVKYYHVLPVSVIYIFSAIIIGTHLYNLFYILTKPEMYLIEEITKML